MDVTGNIEDVKDFRGRKSQNFNITAQKELGSNLIVGGNLAGNTLKEPTVTGFATVKSDNNSITFSKQHVPAFGRTTTTSADVNILKTDQHNLSANAFHSGTTLKNGFSFRTQGGSINYENQSGFAARVGVSEIPNIQKSTSISVSQSLFKAPNTSLDFTTSAVKTCNPSGNCNTNLGTGFSFRKQF